MHNTSLLRSCWLGYMHRAFLGFVLFVTLFSNVQTSYAKLKPPKRQPSKKPSAAPTVEFSVSQLQVGFSLTEAGQVDPANPLGKKTVTATVKPVTLANTLQIVDSSTSKRITITVGSRDPINGKVIFTVAGTQMTPSTASPLGDTTVVAKNGAVSYAQMRVVVIVPYSIKSVIPDPISIVVAGKNLAVNSETSPAYAGIEGQNVPVGQKALRTYYQIIQTVQVVDQFGKPLDDTYKNSPVIESIGNINQPLSSSGTYQDPVGQGQSRIQDGNIVIVPSGGTNVQKWEAQVEEGYGPVPAEEDHGSVAVGVYVAGHDVGFLDRIIDEVPIGISRTSATVSIKTTIRPAISTVP